MLMAFGRLLIRAKPWPKGVVGRRATKSTRFYSWEPPKSARRPLLDRTSGTILAATAGLLMGGFYVSHYEIVPETGRRRFMAISARQEDLLRQQALQETVEKFQGRILPFHHPLTQEVRRITRRLITASNLGRLAGDLSYPEMPLMDPWRALAGIPEAEIPRPPTLNQDKEWVVLVVDDLHFVNAFAAPGLVCVSTGIMPIAGNEAGLAAVIGHEIGHVTMRHTAELISQSKVLLALDALLRLFRIEVDFGLVASLAQVSLPHSRALETEADKVGLKLMARACYDPGAAPRFFETLGKLEKGKVPDFFSTHPPTSERIAHLETLLPECYKIYNSNPECARLDDMHRMGALRQMRMELFPHTESALTRRPGA
ncbi:peptidase family M48-domain-containing protein [Mycena galopus ATCC 62051]|nr:peptidase family M48-domain-containing protein [Mycena galopus ATCC 62051]